MHLFTNNYGDQNRTNNKRSWIRYLEGIFNYPEPLKYILRIYSTDIATCKAIKDIIQLRQSPKEEETTYATTLNRLTYRYSTVQVEEGNMIVYVSRIELIINKIAARFQKDEICYELSLKLLVQILGEECYDIPSREKILNEECFQSVVPGNW